MENVETVADKIIPQTSQTLYGNLPRIGISYLAWLSLYFVSGWISILLLPGVRKLTYKEQMFWRLAMVRGVAGFLTLWATYLAFIDKNLDKDHVLASTDQSWTFLSVLTGFFIFEEVQLIYFDIKFKTFSKELHFHHFFAFNGFFIAAYYNSGHYYAARVFILEASTPFSCVCWCLLKLNLQHTAAWKINQWILINVFHARTFYEIWLWREFYQDWDNIKQNLPILYTINMFTGIALITFWLTPYWTYKKTVQYFYPTDWNADKAKTEKKKSENSKTPDTTTNHSGATNKKAT